MRRVLCYGDSNTWGYDPVTKERFDPDIRWTAVLSGVLGSEYTIIEEGLNGRTTVWDDPIEGYKNGPDYLIPCLETHRPLDLVNIILGTNDLKKLFGLSASDIAEGAGLLVRVVQGSMAGVNGNAPRVLLIAPAPVARLTDLAEMFEGAESKSRRFAEHYGRVAEAAGCDFLDASTTIVSSSLDGIHLEASEHCKLGRAVAAKVNQLIG